MPYSGSPARPRRPYLLRDDPAAHVPGGLDRELDNVEQVHGEHRARQHPPDRRGVDAAHVDADGLDRVPPRRCGPGQPVCGVIGGAALHLSQQPLLPAQVKETGVPPVREQRVLPGLRVCGKSRPAAAVLIDAQLRHRRRACPGSGSTAAVNASCATGQEIPACRAASAGVIPRSAISRPACSRSRAITRHRGGSCGTHSVNVLRPQPSSPHFHRALTHRRSTASPARRTSRGRATTVSCTRHETVPQPGARRGVRVIGDRPHLPRAARPRLHVRDLQALHAGQRRRPILERDARGLLMILNPVGRLKIVKAAAPRSHRHAVTPPDHPRQAHNRHRAHHNRHLTHRHQPVTASH
jgi:hypothetical protein